MTQTEIELILLGVEAGVLLGFLLSMISNRKDIKNLIDEHHKWADKQFPNSTSIGALLHAKGEIDEVIADIKNNVPKKQRTQEYSDAFFCLLHSAHLESIELNDIVKEGWDKLGVNKKRTWKDNGDGSYSHVKQA